MRHHDERTHDEPPDEKTTELRALRPQVTEPPPQRTAFGAPTVGGAVAASAMAGRGRAGEPEVSDEDVATPDDGQVEEG